MKNVIRVLAAGLALAALSVGAQTNVAREMLNLTGGTRCKMVWVRDYKQIVAFDTAEGSERVLVNQAVGDRSWPVITADGKRVVFGISHSSPRDKKNATGGVFVVGWDGGEPRHLSDDLQPLSLWRDPATSIEWVYASEKTGGDGRPAHIHRFQLDKPAVRELVWDQSDADAPFTLSADGRFAASQLPWPNSCLLRLADGERFRTSQGGCNANVAPDNSYRLFRVNFPHNGIDVYRELFAGRTESSVFIPIRPDGRSVERVRASSHPLYLTYFGPMGRPEASDVYLARFTPAYDSLAGSVRLGKPGVNDEFPYAWLDAKPDDAAFLYPLGQFADEAPFAPAFPEYGLGKDAMWDYGDGASGTGMAGRHTYEKPGTYEVTVRSQGRTLAGRVVALPRRAPAVVSVRVVGDRRVLVDLDKTVRFDKPTFTFASGAKSASATLRDFSREILVDADRPLPARDQLTVGGVCDLAQTPNPVTAAPLAIARPDWPTDLDKLAVAWQPGNSVRRVWDTGLFDGLETAVGGIVLPDPYGRLVFTGGGACELQLHWCDITKLTQDLASEITIELAFASGDPAQGSRDGKTVKGANLVNYWYGRDNSLFYVSEENGHLWVKLRTDQSGQRGDDGAVELGALTDTKPHHLVIAYRPDDLKVYLDGKRWAADATLRGKLTHWDMVSLALGGACGVGGVGCGWRGTIEAFAVYGRVLNEAEAGRNCEVFAQRRAARKPIPLTEVEAKLAAMTPLPTAKEIAPYQNALVAFDYEVNRVVSGKCDARKVRVYRWGMFAKERMPDVAKAAVGRTERLRLEPWSAHPELQTQLLRDDLPEDFEAPVFFALP